MEKEIYESIMKNLELIGYERAKFIISTAQKEELN